jgi:transposase
VVFQEKIAGIKPEDLVYVDESGIDTFAYRPYGYAKKGEKIYGAVSGKRYARESFVAAWCHKNILSPMCYQGTCTKALFETWVEEVLVPELKPGQTVILDNATFHKSEKVRHLIEAAGCALLYLPPYSPDFNPIEHFWANLKRFINSNIASFSSLQDAIDHAFKHLSFQTI